MVFAVGVVDGPVVLVLQLCLDPAYGRICRLGKSTVRVLRRVIPHSITSCHLTLYDSLALYDTSVNNDTLMLPAAILVSNGMISRP